MDSRTAGSRGVSLALGEGIEDLESKKENQLALTTLADAEDAHGPTEPEHDDGFTIAVLVPCLNEETTVGDVVRDFRGAMPDGTSVYVYDNGSSDRTAEVAREAGAVVRSVSDKKGKGHVVRRMLREVDADVYVLVDGDSTYSAADAVPMIRDLRADGLDMVIGDRLSSTYDAENKRPFHSLGNRLVRWAVNKTFDADVHDVMTGYRVFTKRMARSFVPLADGFQVETEWTIHALENDMPIKETPVAYKDRPAGSHSKLSTLSDGVRVLWTIFRLMYEHKPLPFFCSLSALTGSVGLWLTVSVWLDYWRTGMVARFPTLIGSVMMIVFAFLCLSTGIVLDVVDRRSRESSLRALNRQA